MKSNNVGLINIQRCDSHGAVLLAYALEQVINEWGANGYNIGYKYAGRINDNNILKKYWLTLKLVLKKRMHLSYKGKKFLGKDLKDEYDKQSEKFILFRKEMLHLTKEIDDPYDEYLKQFDSFVVGSDVVWKPEIVACQDKDIYFLKSVPEDSLKIAYAASIGTNDKGVLTEYLHYYEHAFDTFDYLSIREASMIPFIEQFTEKRVVSLIDPVFLLKRIDYINIEKKAIEKISDKDYIYLYLIGESENAVNEANILASENSWSILADFNAGFDLSKRITVESESAISAGPLEFLYNIRHAKYIITDSFHATAFALLFNIPLCVFTRGKISVRMEDLLSRFNVSECLYNGKKIEKIEMPWDGINMQIERERKEGLDFLRKALGYE